MRIRQRDDKLEVRKRSIFLPLVGVGFLTLFLLPVALGNGVGPFAIVVAVLVLAYLHVFLNKVVYLIDGETVERIQGPTLLRFFGKRRQSFPVQQVQTVIKSSRKRPPMTWLSLRYPGGEDLIFAHRERAKAQAHCDTIDSFLNK